MLEQPQVPARVVSTVANRPAQKVIVRVHEVTVSLVLRDAPSDFISEFGDDDFIGINDGKLTFTTGGSSIGALAVLSVSNIIGAAATNFLTNPTHNGSTTGGNPGITFPRPARINAQLVTGVATGTAAVIEDGGLGIQQVPSLVPLYSITSTTAVVPQAGTATVGGVTDTSYIQAS